MKNYSAYQYRIITTQEGEIANGDYLIDEKITVRIKNGYLCDSMDEEGNNLPAIETSDNSHIEHWKDGLLHYEKEPAVIDMVDGYEEWWVNGKLINKSEFSKER